MKIRHAITGVFALMCVGCQGQPGPAPVGNGPIFAEDGFENVARIVAGDSDAKLLFEDLKATTESFKELDNSASSKKERLKLARDLSQQVMQHAFLYRTTNNQMHLEQAKKYLKAACELEDWNPKHFLDVAETAFSVSVAANWLDGNLDAELKRKVGEALEMKAFDEFRKEVNGSKDPFWVSGSNNWTIVCNSGLYVAAVLNPNLASSGEVREKSYQYLKLGMNLFAPDGLWAEGPMYWSYAVNYAIFAIEAEKWSTEKESSLQSYAGLNKTLPTFFALIGPSGKTFNYADVNTEGVGVTPAVLKLAAYFDHPNEANTYLDIIAKRADRSDKDVDHRFTLFNLLWFPKQHNAPTELETPQIKLIKGKFDIAVINSNPGKAKNIYLAIKAGNAKDSHQHRDAGSFVLDHKKVRFFCDLGKENYNLKDDEGKEVDKRSVFRVSSKAHNLIRIGDREQAEKTTAQAVVSGSGNAQSVSFDLSAAYAETASSVKRTVSVEGNSILMEDVVQGGKGSIVWQGMTETDMSIAGKTVTMVQKEKQLVVEVVEPKNAQIRIEQPKCKYNGEKSLKKYRQLLIVCPEGTERIKVRFSPL